MSGSNIKYKGRERKKGLSKLDNNLISFINSYLFYYSKSNLQAII